MEILVEALRHIKGVQSSIHGRFLRTFQVTATFCPYLVVLWPTQFSNINESQAIFLGIRAAGVWSCQLCRPSCAKCQI
jgi:hypothetical protein